jgi:hypothetical protein
VAEEPRNPKNAAGPFYVVKGQCISCGAPRAEAPGLVTLDEDGCYFHKQPETPAEVNAAIRAMSVSCIEVYRYGGDDPNIRHRLAELGYARLCDRPLEGHAVVRNRVRFSLDQGDRATNVATALLSAFERTWPDGKCTRMVGGDAERAEFQYTHSATYGTPRRYIVERVPKPTHGTPSSVYRAPAPPQVWLLTEDDARHTPIWLHDVLTKTAAVGIRWFSRVEWEGRQAGQELPY